MSISEQLEKGRQVPEDLTPSVSVVMPVFNAGPGLVKALEGIAGLTGANYEFLVVDDGSTDGSDMLVSTWAEKHPFARPILLSENRGAGCARNRGLAEASGEFVWFVDCDDEWEPDILSRMLERAIGTSADIVACRSMRVSESGVNVGIVESFKPGLVVSGARAYGLVLEGRIQGHLHTKLIRRALLPTDPFPAIAVHEDLCGVVLAIAGARRVATMGDVLYRYMEHPGSLSMSDDPATGDVDFSADVVLSVASDDGVSARGLHVSRLMMLRFTYAYRYLGKIGVARRWRDRSSAFGVVRSVRREMSLSEVLFLSIRYPATAARALLIMVAGTKYFALATGLVMARGWLRRLRDHSRS